MRRRGISCARFALHYAGDSVKVQAVIRNAGILLKKVEK
jgi:hypothetical protein